MNRDGMGQPGLRHGRVRRHRYDTVLGDHYCRDSGAIRYLMPGQGQGTLPAAKRDPMEILKERYAKGEIDTEEYEECKRVLENGS